MARECSPIRDFVDEKRRPLLFLLATGFSFYTSHMVLLLSLLTNAPPLPHHIFMHTYNYLTPPLSWISQFAILIKDKQLSAALMMFMMDVVMSRVSGVKDHQLSLSPHEP